MTDHETLPHTRDSLAAEFRALGLTAGQTVLVHSSLRRIGGWIIGGAQTVIEALLEVLEAEGTLMMPTHTTNNTEPSHWQNPPVPEAWWQFVRDNTPAFDPVITETRMMGVLAEQFRHYPGVIRSNHPVGSFAASGKHAAYLTADHDYRRDIFGDDSPIGKLYELDGYVMLLGVGHGNDTSLHLAEFRAQWASKGQRMVDEGSAILIDGKRQWVSYQMMPMDTDDFELLGADYEASIGYKPGQIGQATTHLLRQRPLVDFAVQWMERNRK